MLLKPTKLPTHLRNKILTFCEAFGAEATAHVLEMNKKIKIPEEFRPEVIKLLEEKKKKLVNKKLRDSQQIRNIINISLAEGISKTIDFIDLFHSSMFIVNGPTERLFTKTLDILHEIHGFQIAKRTDNNDMTEEDFRQYLYMKTNLKPNDLPMNLKNEIVKLWLTLGPHPKAQIVEYLNTQDFPEQIKKQVADFMETVEFKNMVKKVEEYNNE